MVNILHAALVRILLARLLSNGEWQDISARDRCTENGKTTPHEALQAYDS